MYNSMPVEKMAAFDAGTQHVNVIIETPKGSRAKYVYSPPYNLFRIKRLLPPGMAFPYNYGFIPSTVGEDGDPLDILIINPEPVAVGCLLRARLLAVIHARQTENGKTMANNRFIGAIVDEESPPEFLLAEFDKRQMAEIEFFFATYNSVSGKKFKTSHVGTAKEAEKLIRTAEKMFRDREKSRLV